MGFMQTGINNQPLKKPDTKQPTFTEYGIVNREPEKKPESKAVEIAKRLTQNDRKPIDTNVLKYYGAAGGSENE